VYEGKGGCSIKERRLSFGQKIIEGTWKRPSSTTIKKEQVEVMLFVIDVGNTNIVLGLYDQERLRFDWRIQTDHAATADITGCALSSVVPPLTETIRSLARKYFALEPIVLEPGVRTGLNIMYDNPREVGADRIVNAVAAIEQYGKPVIVVDFGTATTFDLIDEQGNYCGGTIVPGVQISAESLLSRAAKLPRVEIVKPASVIGKNSVESIQAGLFYGYVSLVDGMVTRIQALLSARAKVVATGGLAELICGETETIDEVDPELTLTGLKLIYERNR
jgi:type III pantothenate kinase